MYTPEEIAEAGLDDFRVFLIQVWDFLGLPDPTPTQLDIAYWLQHGPNRLVIQAFRGVGKSWITTTFALWNLFRNPDFKVEVVSAGGDLANDISTFALRLIREMPLLQHMMPRRDQRQSTRAFDVNGARASKDPSFKSAGITGQITGTRADLLIADDIEIPKNAYTHHLREKLSEQVKEFAAILKPEDHARIIYLGTPQVEESLYPKLRERGYTIMVWPAEVPENPDEYNGTLAPRVQKMIEAGLPAGTPVDPVRFDSEVLLQKKAEYGRAGYALQFMLNTNPSAADKHPLKTQDLIIHDLDPEVAPVKLVWGRGRAEVIEDLPSGGFAGDCYYRPIMVSPEYASYTGTVMAIDPAGRGKDELAYAIVRVLHSMLFLVDSGGFLDGYSEETLRALAAAAARHGVNYVITEKNYGGGMFDELLKPYLHRAGVGGIDEEWKGWSTGMKEARILDTLEPIIQQHRLVVDRRVIEKDLEVLRETPRYSLIYQMTRMERTKGALANEDRLEALAMACQYWVDRMNQDQETVLERHREELLENELREFMENAIGYPRADFYYHGNFLAH